MNVGGPLGLDDQDVRQYPTEVMLPPGVSAEEVGTGSDFTCIRAGGEVYCWGLSGSGQIGFAEDPSMNSDGCANFCRLTPAQVIDETNAVLSGVAELEVHYQGACARLDDHTLRCWGAGLSTRASEPTIGGSMLTGVAQHTSCSSTALPTAIRYLTRDGALNRPSSEVEPICPE